MHKHRRKRSSLRNLESKDAFTEINGSSDTLFHPKLGEANSKMIFDKLEGATSDTLNDTSSGTNCLYEDDNSFETNSNNIYLNGSSKCVSSIQTRANCYSKLTPIFKKFPIGNKKLKVNDEESENGKLQSKLLTPRILKRSYEKIEYTQHSSDTLQNGRVEDVCPAPTPVEVDINKEATNRISDLDVENNKIVATGQHISNNKDQNQKFSDLKRPGFIMDCPILSKKSFSGHSDSDISENDDLSSGRLRKHRHSKSYQVDLKKCPIEGCDSKGHLYGKYEHHYTSKTCPLHHNLTPEKCLENFKANHRLKQSLLTVEDEDADMNGQLEIKPSRKPVEAVTSSTPITSQVEKPASNKKRKFTNSLEYKKLIKEGHSHEDVMLFYKSKESAAQKHKEEAKRFVEGSCKKVSKKSSRQLEFGHYRFECLSPSRYVEEYCPSWKIHICEFCLKYIKSESIYKRHKSRCTDLLPPGNEIYRRENISIFEVDGLTSKMYCENLCLLAMLFIQSKTVHLETEQFTFYVMTDYKDTGHHHIIGYFSKEKKSFLNHNLSCILTLPHYLRKGYGRMLIDLSYIISKRNRKYGSPERPLSEQGLKAYKAYWSSCVLEIFSNLSKITEITVRSLCDATSIYPRDMIYTLKQLHMIRITDGKPFICIDDNQIEEWKKKQVKLKSRFSNRQLYQENFKWVTDEAPSTSDSL